MSASFTSSSTTSSVNNSSNNPLNVFKSIVEKQIENLNHFMKSLKEEIEKTLNNPSVMNNLVNQRDRYLKNYIEGLKLENDPDQGNFIHASQVLDYFQEAILLKK